MRDKPLKPTVLPSRARLHHLRLQLAGGTLQIDNRALALALLRREPSLRRDRWQRFGSAGSG